MKIIIPSYNRAGSVTTYDAIPGSLIVIPESNYDEYLKYYDNSRLVVIPNNRDGNVAKKRNAVLDVIDDDEIFMIDDDLVSIMNVISREYVDGDVFVDVIKNGFRMINDLGIGFFGFNWSNQPLHSETYKPFSLNKRFYCGMGIKRCDLRFDENLIRLEDADFWLQQTRKYKMTLRFNHYFIKCKYKAKKQTGGIETKDDGKENERYMLNKWGSNILKYSRNNELLAGSPYNGV